MQALAGETDAWAWARISLSPLHVGQKPIDTVAEVVETSDSVTLGLWVQVTNSVETVRNGASLTTLLTTRFAVNTGASWAPTKAAMAQMVMMNDLNMFGGKIPPRHVCHFWILKTPHN